MRFLLSGLLTALLTVSALAHFVYVVPSNDGKTITVVMSEDLEADEAVSIEKISGTTLTARAADGKESTIATKVEKHALTARVPEDAKLLYGDVTYGLLERANTKPALLVYHPKAILSGCDETSANLGAKAVIEISTRTTNGKTALRVASAGKPIADAEVNILLPNGERTKLKTNADGLTEAVSAKGRYAAWVRHLETKAGMHDGKPYEEIRHYATLVVDLK